MLTFRNQPAELVRLVGKNALIKVGTTTFTVPKTILGIRTYELNILLFSHEVVTVTLISSDSALNACITCLKQFIEETYYWTNQELIKSFSLTVDDEEFDLPYSLQDSLMEQVALEFAEYYYDY